MTHDELLDKVTNNSELEDCWMALQKVIQLHTPIFRGCDDDMCCGSSDVCGHCADDYPCDTMRVIEKEIR